eukprot:gene7651-17020_t
MIRDIFKVRATALELVERWVEAADRTVQWVRKLETCEADIVADGVPAIVLFSLEAYDPDKRKSRKLQMYSILGHAMRFLHDSPGELRTAESDRARKIIRLLHPMTHGIEGILAVLRETRDSPLYRGIGAMVAKKWKSGGEICN